MRITSRELNGRDPAEVRCMQPLEGVDLEAMELLYMTD